MDHVFNSQSQLKIVEIVSKGLSEGGNPWLAQIVAWLACARSNSTGHLDTWGPDELDLVATLGYYEDNRDDDSHR
ncbi:hypothetical protein BDK92_0868 [Micromonospora pisi]|uniref:Uncharacterized protein n=2 Tax=Micromonospora pisi TaxID=589240 RepID=A0A495JCH8_9ACTN|nr:hypothetical protein BDK92_0868 [Micromonospora pisi]